MSNKVLYFRNSFTKARYRVLRQFVDTDGVRKVELQGETATFLEPFDKERFKKLGYTLEAEETDDDE